MIERTRRWRWVTGAALAATFATSCSLAGRAGPEHFGDTGVGYDVGTSTRDTGASVDASPVVPRGDTGTGGREDTDVACADFTDDDGNMLTDCADTTSCGTLPICCVGSTDARCCSAPSAPTPVLTVDGCTGTALAGCVTNMATFGSPLPNLVTTRSDGGSCPSGSSVAPQGSDHSDGGLVASETIDATIGAMAIEARLGVSLTSASTLDAIAVGLTAQPDLAGATTANVRPLVAIVVSATDHTIRAVAGDIAFPTHPLATILDPGCTELEVRIETSPAGTFDAFYRLTSTARWVALETGRPFEPSTLARVVAYGRSTNPGLDGVHAWVRSVSVARRICDVLDPARSSSGAFVALPAAGHAIHSVSRVGPIAVYEMDGSIYAAGVDGTGHLQALGRTGTDGDRILAPGEAPFMMSGLADPELVAIDDNRRLFFTAIDAMGTRSIGYLDFDTDVAQRVTMSTPRLLVPPADLGVMGVDGPAYFETRSPAPDGSTTTHRWIVFRAIVDATHSELRAAELAGSSALLGTNLETRDVSAAPAQFYTTASPLTPAQAIYANRESETTAFDRDEIAAPELIAYGGVIRVFFAARRGARWSIGMLRSPDFAHFELAYPDAILSGSGSGFDAVSVTDPDVTVDASGELTLYYTASDGTTTQPGLATQEVP